MDAGVTIRAARIEAGLTQRALARLVGTSQATVSAYESGAKQPSVLTFSRLLAATGHRLEVAPAAVVVEPSRRELLRAGRVLADVIGLAEALPVRHGERLRYPRLHARPVSGEGR